MKNVSYISASAGSGKTYTLTETLAGLIKEGKAEADRVVLTTFTIKAAEEFKERAKQKLYQYGLFESASLLDQALIGTIHSVANSFVRKYWYFLGLSPSLDIIAEDDADFFRSQSLSSLPTQQEILTLREFVRQFEIYKMNGFMPSKRFDYDFWKEDLRNIIDFSTNYGISDYALSREKSKALFKGFIDASLPALPSGGSLAAVMKTIGELLSAEKETGASNQRKEDYKQLLYNCNRPTVAFYKKLAKLISKIPKALKKTAPELDGVELVSASVWRSSKVYDLVAGYIDIVFDLAERWRGRYADFKKEHNLLDFNDLEKYFLELLNHPVCSKEIGREFRFVFVDEFQDCSPIQVKIFDRLSELVEHSYWVGDTKQAIYGFRGSDTELTDALVSIIETSANNCDISTLDTSYRSVPGIVDFCNAIFTNLFAGTIDPAKVVLKPYKNPCATVDPLELWNIERQEDIASHVLELIRRGERPSDIAILGRKQDPLSELAVHLGALGIPVNRGSVAIADSKVTALACAVLGVADNEANTLAKAKVAFLNEPDVTTEELIKRILETVDEDGNPHLDFLDSFPLLQRVKQIGPKLRHQSVAAFAESLFLELNLFEEARKCAPVKEVTSVLQTIVAQAAVFEERCVRLNIVPTVSGFVSMLSDSDNGILIPGDPEGVNLLTMHAAKGLQWKNVVVTSLSLNPADEKDCLRRELFGVHFRRSQAPSCGNLYPEVYVALHPFIYGQGSRASLPSPLDDMARNLPEFKPLLQKKMFEEGRLLYVALTRPSVRLILVGDNSNALRWFKELGVSTAKSSEDFVNNYGFKVKSLEAGEEGVDADGITSRQNNDQRYTFNRELINASYLLRDYAPSLLRGIANVASSVDFNFRIPVGKLPEGKDESHLGNCLHQIFRCHEFAEPETARIREIVKLHGLELTLPDCEAVSRSWHNLLKSVTERHGKIIARRHERPFMLTSEGKVFTGSIDLTLDTENGLVLVDYKSCPMGNSKILDPENAHFAGRYGAQLGCYAAALREAGTPPVAAYVYYPVSGLLVELDLDSLRVAEAGA